MFKDILVPMFTDDIPEHAIAAACSIAGSHQAHVDALVGVSMILPNAVVWAYSPEKFHQVLEETAGATVAIRAARVEERLKQESIPHGVRRCTTLWLTTTEMAARCAQYADLVVLARGKASHSHDRHLFAGLLVDSGRPLLLVPDKHDALTGHAVIAWKASREATRALHDALPLLRTASSVDLLHVEGESEYQGASREDDNRVVAHLARHGVIARRIHCPGEHVPAGIRILEHADKSGAGLIVAGGYGHSRAREQVFGGVTQTLLERASCAVFFSH